MDPINGFIPTLSHWFHMQPSTVVFWWFVLTTGCNAIARVIPDNSTGWKHWIRKAAQIVGVYVPSRVAPGITVQQAAIAGATQQNIPALHRQIVETQVRETEDAEESHGDLYEAFLENARKRDAEEAAKTEESEQ